MIFLVICGQSEQILNGHAISRKKIYDRENTISEEQSKRNEWAQSCPGLSLESIAQSAAQG